MLLLLHLVIRLNLKLRFIFFYSTDKNTKIISECLYSEALFHVKFLIKENAEEIKKKHHIDIRQIYGKRKSFHVPSSAGYIYLLFLDQNREETNRSFKKKNYSV